MNTNRLYNFVACDENEWRIVRLETVVGEPLDHAEGLSIIPGHIANLPSGTRWVLRGVTSQERYVHRAEQDRLKAIQPPLSRPEATHAALIPIRKSDAWWALAQDERRAIFEDRSHHIESGLRALPAVARRLHHSRDLGEPFDFLTWFEYAPEDEAIFEALVQLLRETEEWKYVDREIDIRLVRC